VRKWIEPISSEAGVMKVVLFGSYATGKQTAASDIDLLVVIDAKRCDKDSAYKLIRRSIKLAMVELHILSKEEYQLMSGSKWIKTIEEEGETIICGKGPP
jgi:predicted nucleotidyltransferase